MNKFNHAYYNSILKEADKKGGKVKSVNLNNSFIKELPSFLNDLTVTDELILRGNYLTSCKNFPRVEQYLWLDRNKLETLEGMKNIPSRTFYAPNNNLTSIETLSDLEGDKCWTVSFENNKLKSLKGLENIDVTSLNVGNNEISSWDYIPEKLDRLSIYKNKLTSWKGMPKHLYSLYAFDNWDVQNFNDYERVTDSLEISSTRWKDEYDLASYLRNVANIMKPQSYLGLNPQQLLDDGQI
jgi:hypothetical protein